MRINVHLKHRKGTTEAKVLIDSGAEGLLIDKQFCFNNDIPTQKIDRPIPVFNVDGTANEGGQITDKVCVLMRITNKEGDYHDEQCELLAANLGGENVILGTDWLHEHNPQINWVKNSLTFSNCATTCLISRPKFTVQALLPIRQRKNRTIGYSRIEDSPEEDESEDTFFSKFYEEWYYQNPLEVHPLEAIHIGSIGNKSQQLAEEANKAKTERPSKEIVPAYVLKQFAKIFSQEASQ
ncbi:hypothetical protein HETIRDRAFT_330087 [Heterobasidion irregulare TC 32-1]|uniref:Uncharacterized protein n=1 Tax=Heterobasidion irregulare (strain TC 32-1) TaxID=747525 RepID=W4JSQ2_HETIT|nr:uncharacterized protein HETIRDRAFT_330087 [Heterobasidion irregulare TC 32-1]ETW75886.1 hypothetical protein HETIRDRAFT_330087 [Heterobasidion irregulare TC 32-1]